MDTVRPQRAGGGTGALDGGQRGRDTRTAEDVGDDHVPGGRSRALQGRAGVTGADVDSAVGRQGQVLGDQGEQGRVGVHGALPGTGAGGGGVPGQRQRTSAQVQHIQRSRRGDGVQEMGDAAGVLELQVGGVVQIEVGLGGAVHGQQPGGVAVQVGQQARGAVVHRADDGQGFAHGPHCAGGAARPSG